MHLSSNPAFWYATRASGVAAYVILTLVVCIGMSMGGKVQSPRWPRFSVEDIHRFGGLLVGALIGIHVVTIAVDSFLPFSVLNLVVPFTSSYRPLWTGLGIAAAELLLALAVTNHYRRRLPYAFWRKAHYANFAVWTLASLHGVMSGTDRSVWWLTILYGFSIAAVIALLVWRFGRKPLLSGAVALTALATGLAVPIILNGPLYHAPPIWDANTATERLTGTIIRNGTNVTQIVSFVGQAKKPQKLLLRADLLVGAGGLQHTALQLEYLPSADVCRGTIIGVSQFGFRGKCRLANGSIRFVEASWGAQSRGNTAIGTIRLSG